METKTETKTETKAKSEQLVNIRIPINPLNPKDLTVPVTVNGKRTEYRRGEVISVPAHVVKILEQAGYL